MIHPTSGISDTPASTLHANWSQLGLLINTPPSNKDLDLERLLLATARGLPHHARLFPLVITWLTHYGNFIARHRLKRLILTELEPESQPVLALLLESAIQHGSSRELRIAVEACSPVNEPYPLFIVQQNNKSLARIARQNASALSRKWGVWAPETKLKPDALRPVSWLLKHNPSYRSRIIRKGDLRCSILETLKRDITPPPPSRERAGVRVNRLPPPLGEGRGGGVSSSFPRQRKSSDHPETSIPSCSPPSESALARLCAATRVATRKALAALIQEGEITITPNPDNRRSRAVRLSPAP